MEAVGDKRLPGSYRKQGLLSLAIRQCSKQLTLSLQAPGHPPLKSMAQPLSKLLPEEFCQKSVAPSRRPQVKGLPCYTGKRVLLEKGNAPNLSDLGQLKIN